MLVRRYEIYVNLVSKWVEKYGVDLDWELLGNIPSPIEVKHLE